MSKWDKLIQRIKTIDHDLRFAEIQKVMESFGYTRESLKERESKMAKDLTYYMSLPYKMVIEKMWKTIPMYCTFPNYPVV